MMRIQQRIKLKFLVCLGKTEALKLLQKVYGKDTMSRTRIFEAKRFEEGREDVEDDPRSGRPSTSRTGDNVEREKKKCRSIAVLLLE